MNTSILGLLWALAVGMYIAAFIGIYLYRKRLVYYAKQKHPVYLPDDNFYRIVEEHTFAAMQHNLKVAGFDEVKVEYTKHYREEK